MHEVSAVHGATYVCSRHIDTANARTVRGRPRGHVVRLGIDTLNVRTGLGRPWVMWLES